MTSDAPARRALVVGATGIVGQTLAATLAAEGWQTFGLSRAAEALPTA